MPSLSFVIFKGLKYEEFPFLSPQSLITFSLIARNKTEIIET